MHGQREDLLGSERGPWRLIGCHLRMAAVARVVVDQLRLAGHRIDARGVQAFGELVRVRPGLGSHLNGVLMPDMEPVDRSARQDQPAQPGEARGQQGRIAAAVGLDGRQPIRLHAGDRGLQVGQPVVAARHRKS